MATPEVQIGVVGFAQVMGDLSALEPAIAREVRAELREIMGDVASTARGNAGWSSRIPGAIRPSVGRKNLNISVRSQDAPHAKAYEGLAKGGSRSAFRHPVFGRDVWVTQSTRPFVMPAVDQHREEALERVEEVLDRATDRLGWGGI